MHWFFAPQFYATARSWVSQSPLRLCDVTARPFVSILACLRVNIEALLQSCPASHLLVVMVASPGPVTKRKLRKAKEALDCNRVFAHVVPPFLQVPTTPAQAIEDSDAMSTTDTVVDPHDVLPAPSAMHIDCPQPISLHQLIQFPGYLPVSPQATAGPSQFPGCLNWDEQAIPQREAPFAYLITPAGYENLCSAVQHLQQASVLIQTVVNTSEVYLL
ncbi:hypothetical protein EST38_g14273 [Candolleomyces aberdarensis]|uniref:Uncharacterized protein n=1 Tax=Candolleomyces aberdarensis TaxID=2316362 RepID=A0A4Q2CYV4_9AGAR|nr:hypothetical protein EST38_g14273 [Candolleomyces aberdarensis]